MKTTTQRLFVHAAVVTPAVINAALAEGTVFPDLTVFLEVLREAGVVDAEGRGTVPMRMGRRMRWRADGNVDLLLMARVGEVKG